MTDKKTNCYKCGHYGYCYFRIKISNVLHEMAVRNATDVIYFEQTAYDFLAGICNNKTK